MSQESTNTEKAIDLKYQLCGTIIQMFREAHHNHIERIRQLGQWHFL